MSKLSEMTFEQIFEHCLQLRRKFERDEARFFLGLVAVETECMETLKASGVETFESFIHSADAKRCLIRPERYRAFANGLKHVTKEEAEEMGAPAVIELGRSLHDASKVDEYKAAVSSWSEMRGGMAPTQQTAKRLLMQVDPRPETPEPIRRLGELERLREENAALRREVKRLKDVIRDMIG